MALERFSTDLLTVSVNGRLINDWGTADPPWSDSSLDDPSVLMRGLGGGAIRFDRTNPGRAVTLSLMPGSPDSAYMQGLFNSKANVTITFTQIGTLEEAVGTEGLIVNDGPRNRGGPNISDDVYNLQFNGWTAFKGGN